MIKLDDRDEKDLVQSYIYLKINKETDSQPASYSAHTIIQFDHTALQQNINDLNVYQ